MNVSRRMRPATHLRKDTLVSPDQIPTPSEYEVLHASIDGLTQEVGKFNQSLKGVRVRVLILAVVVAVVFVASLGLVALAVHVNTVVACQARENDAFRTSATQVRGSRDVQDDDQLQMLNVVLDPTKNPDQRQAAIRVYRDQVQVQKQQRSESPFPDGNCA